MNEVIETCAPDDITFEFITKFELDVPIDPSHSGVLSLVATLNHTTVPDAAALVSGGIVFAVITPPTDAPNAGSGNESVAHSVPVAGSFCKGRGAVYNLIVPKLHNAPRASN